mgnify:CR=1 FL=1
MLKHVILVYTHVKMIHSSEYTTFTSGIKALPELDRTNKFK